MLVVLKTIKMLSICILIKIKVYVGIFIRAEGKVIFLYKIRFEQNAYLYPHNPIPNQVRIRDKKDVL